MQPGLLAFPAATISLVAGEWAREFNPESSAQMTSDLNRWRRHHKRFSWTTESRRISANLRHSRGGPCRPGGSQTAGTDQNISNATLQTKKPAPVSPAEHWAMLEQMTNSKKICLVRRLGFPGLGFTWRSFVSYRKIFTWSRTHVKLSP